MLRWIKKAALWLSPAVLIWIVLSVLNARIYFQGLRDGKFPPEADSIAIPIFGFSIAVGFALLALTLLVFGVNHLYRRYWNRHALPATLATLAMLGIAAWIPYQQKSHERNLDFISKDVGFEIPKISETLLYRTPWRFDLNDFSCSILYVPSKELTELQQELDGDEGWRDFSGNSEPDWETCLKGAQGFHFRTFSKIEDSVETKILIGFAQDQQLLLHAYAVRLLPRSGK